MPLYTTPQPISLVNSEPVAYIFKHPAGRLFWALTDESNKGQNDVMPVYASPQPAPERDQVRIAHAEWSQATFGNVGPVGPLKHLSKEALETAADPGDLSEWADMQFLLWDAQRRAGVTDEQITQAMIDKLAVNKQRKWPEPKDGEPRLHIKEQPAPVVPDERDKAVDADDHPLLWSFNEGWNACRAAMLQTKSLTCINPAPDLVSLQKKAESIIGNYPGIPDCWCRTCRPVVLNDMRFVVCPDCGNKRCPRANDHRNACTGSNEPGQEGSAYPDTLREVK
ncbi:DUF550 domain-containing protein [Klebsiella pneumoniae]|nr:DUF550 domain-containing protein [Klebsiella pneumoniae]MEA8727977.1 DUF550 domain-containing protein [Klebsiella pneumoniae]